MATNFLLKSVKVHNYRGLTDFESPKFKRVNLIGGLNASGKTTLLEALFTSMDWANPSTFVKTSLWRNIGGTLESVSRYLFSNEDRSKPIQFFANTRDFEVHLEFLYEKQIAPPSMPVSPEVSGGPQDTTTASMMGITATTRINGVIEDQTHILDAAGGLHINKPKASQRPPRPCVMISRATIGMHQDLATRFTVATQNRQKRRLIQFIAIAITHIGDLELLQVGGASHLYGIVDNGSYVPLVFLGDGALTLASIALAIMNSPNGAIFLDEFDTAIHYSRLKNVWVEIVRLANEFNCQIFAATHSRECIEAAVEGLGSAGLGADLQYIRLDRRDGKITATPYGHSELAVAVEEDWDVR